jgi:hypothetical protein
MRIHFGSAMRLDVVGKYGIGVAVLSLMMSGSGAAQTVGLKTGYPLTNAFQASGSDPHVSYVFNGRRPAFGLTAELNLPAKLVLEIDGLYSSLYYNSTNMGVDVLTRSTTSVNCWDFPILVKKRFTESAIRPYVVAGAAFRAVNADADVVTTVLPGNPSETTMRPLELTHQVTAGFAFGAGIEFRIGKLHLLPELRYMRFERENFGAATGVFHSNLRQPEFLLGFQMGKL